MDFLNSLESRYAYAKILPCVRFKEFNIIIFTIQKAFGQIASEYGVEPVITGAWGEDIYPKGGVHDKGNALDYRSRDFVRPIIVASDLERRLKLIDKGFRVLYHDSGNGFHFHIEWQTKNQFPFRR